MPEDLLPPPGGAGLAERKQGEEPSHSKSHRPPSSDSSSSTDSKGPIWTSNALDSLTWPGSLQWAPDNFTWAKVKPAIRSAVAAWLSLVLFVIPKVEVFLGQASFLILITSFMSPPSDPFMAVLEREFTILFFVATAWAWGCLGIKLADLARVNHNPNASFLDAITGQYLEVASTVIVGVFIFLGSTVLLYIKARAVPSQIFACLLGCLCGSIGFIGYIAYNGGTISTGKAIILPIAFHSAVALLCSIVIFPSTISSQFTTRLALVLAPLTKSFELHQIVLEKDPYSPEFASTVATIVASVAKSEAGLVPLAASARLLKSDLIYSRFQPTDFIALQTVAKRMAVRANGMGRYFTLLDPMREKFPVTPGPSRGGTPVPGSPAVSRPPSLRSPSHEHMEDLDMDGDSAPPTPTRRSRHSHHHSHRHNLHNSLLHHLSLKTHHVVGVFESHRYLDLEARLNHPEVTAHTKETTRLLSQSCTPLLKSCQDSLVWIQDWLGFVRRGALSRWLGGAKKQRVLEQRMGELEATRETLRTVLNRFRTDNRHIILEPWLPSFDPNHAPEEIPPHRHLFHCYFFQYHLIQVSENLATMLDTIHTMEKERKKPKLWTPAHGLSLDWSNWHLSEFDKDEEDPDTIQGYPPAAEEYDLGTVRRRDPDALPPRNRFEWTMSFLYRAFMQLGRGNTLFAIKAATLTVIMCLPSLLKSSATFAYENRFVWAIFMGQTTLARFRGDTVFGISSRILSTFWGVVLGLVMWYISTGAGNGSPYGLAAVCAVCYPFFFYGRLYWPGPPMRMLVFFITSILVVGYSYQDQYIRLPGNPGFGWEVAWRRFILVTAGVVAAGFFSLLPPSTTIRRYERMTMATTASEIGTMYCDVISYANIRQGMDPQDIVTGLIAIRSKILRSITLKSNAIYEFSMRGRWPAKRYQKIMELQLQLAYSLSHLMSVVEHMEPSWTRAFLRRTRFLDADFQGDVLAVITMVSTALRTGCALPQITPCPLIDRFQSQFGLNVIHKDSEDDYGLPRTLTLETLKNEQYLRFCVGVATTYGFLSRLDRLMVTAKEIVGEQYHIHGAGVALTRIVPGGGVPLGSRTNTLQYSPPQV
ncbi:hypothetical protein DFH06DRAFT_968491 [Mycena polygramma]|nr:hypothetical protein DFH06DRAFT_968491 [Mycena polygramma]